MKRMITLGAFSAAVFFTPHVFAQSSADNINAGDVASDIASGANLDRNLSRLPDMEIPEITPSQPHPGGAHIGYVWVTPVLIQKAGASGVSSDGGARVRVSGATGRVRNGDRDAYREDIKEDVERHENDSGDVGSSQEALINPRGLTQLQLEQEERAREDQGVQRASSSAIEQKQVEARKQEARERRMCEREARNAWETFTGWLGAKHTEECPSSVRRRETVRVADRSALSVENTLYFINLSTRNETTVEIVCRMRDRGETITANVSVAPLDYGEWTPPCACDQDYKFWCTLASAEPIAAHAIQDHKSGVQESMEYVDFFLVR